MIYFSKLIKGLLLTAIFLATFTVSTRVAVNPADVPDKSFTLSSGEQTDIRLADFFAKAYARTAAEIQSEIDILQTKLNQGNITSENWATQTDALEDDLEAAQAIEEARGEEGEGKPSTTRDPLLLLEDAAKASTFVNHIFNPLIHMLTFQIGNFLGNDYIYAGNMGKMLQNIWVVSRNIVNIAFVLILLYIAVMHIFKEDEDTGALVKKLRIFVIMLIAVNFSWLATKLVLDAANVATQVVFSIPAGVKGVGGGALPVDKEPCLVNEEANGPNTTKGPCTAEPVYYPVGATEAAYYKDGDCPSEDDVNKANPKSGTEVTDENLKKISNKVIYCWHKIDLAKYNQNNASLHLSFSMARVQNLVRANTNDDLPKTIIAVLFSLIIQVVFLVAFAALYVVLIARVAALWIFVAFSPFLVLLLFLKKGLDKDVGGGASGYFSIEEFTKWAFAPAKVGAVWAVGFIMVTAGQTTTAAIFKTAKGGGSTVINISSLFLGMENMQEFIWLLLTVGILWMGTFSMMSDLKVVGTFADGMKRWGSEKARMLATAPKWAPIIPQFDAEGKYTGMTSGVKLVAEIKKRYGLGELGIGQKFASGRDRLKTDLPKEFRNDGKRALQNKSADFILKKLIKHTNMTKQELLSTEPGNRDKVITMLHTSTHFTKDQATEIVTRLYRHPGAAEIRRATDLALAASKEAGGKEATVVAKDGGGNSQAAVPTTKTPPPETGTAQPGGK